MAPDWLHNDSGKSGTSESDSKEGEEEGEEDSSEAGDSESGKHTATGGAGGNERGAAIGAASAGGIGGVAPSGSSEGWSTGRDSLSFIIQRDLLLVSSRSRFGVKSFQAATGTVCRAHVSAAYQSHTKKHP